MPAAGPAESGGPALHRAVEFRGVRVVGLRDRALLRAECLGRIAPNIRHRFRIDATGGRQRVTNRDDGRVIAHDMDEGLRADVARSAVANPIGRFESCARFRQLPAFVVTEAERSDPVVFDLDYELGRIRRAAQQVALRVPCRRVRSERAL